MRPVPFDVERPDDTVEAARRARRAGGGGGGSRSALVAVGGFLLLYVGVTFAQVWMASRHDGATQSDAIVVLGAAQYDGRPSPVLPARLDHAFELWEATGSRRSSS